MALLLKEAKSRGWNLLASADIPAKFVIKYLIIHDVKHRILIKGQKVNPWKALPRMAFSLVILNLY